MSQTGEAAEQVVKVTTNALAKGAELAGKGALSLAAFLIAVLNEQKRTKGRTHIKSFNGKPTKVFVIRRSDLKQFAEEAKKYGMLYAAIYNKKENDGIVDVVVNAADAARVNRIAERFTMPVEEVDELRASILRSCENAGEPGEKAHAIDDSTIDAMYGKQSVEIGGSSENPTRARTGESVPSAPTSDSSRDIEGGITMSNRPSVRREIRELKERRRAERDRGAPEVGREVQNKQRKRDRGKER